MGAQNTGERGKGTGSIRNKHPTFKLVKLHSVFATLDAYVEIVVK